MTHNIHHFKTFKFNNVTQFVSPEERQKLDHEMFLKDVQFAGHLKKTKYGLRAQPNGLLFISLFASIVLGTPILLMLGVWVFIGTIPFMYFLPYFMSRVIHPFVHMPYEQALNSTSSILLRRFLKTEYMQRIIRYHSLHHKYISCNYNLVLGADYILNWNHKERLEDKNKVAIKH